MVYFTSRHEHGAARSDGNVHDHTMNNGYAIIVRSVRVQSPWIRVVIALTRPCTPDSSAPFSPRVHVDRCDPFARNPSQGFAHRVREIAYVLGLVLDIHVSQRHVKSNCPATMPTVRIPSQFRSPVLCLHLDKIALIEREVQHSHVVREERRVLMPCPASLIGTFLFGVTMHARLCFLRLVG